AEEELGLLLQLSQREVRGVRLHFRELPPALGVELPHQLGIALERLGSGHVLDPMLVPESVRVAEGAHAALGAHSRAGQDEDALAQRNHRQLTLAQAPLARKDPGMVAAQLTQELSRKMHVQGGLLRAAAVRVAYLAYSRALLHWTDESTGEAAASL